MRLAYLCVPAVLLVSPALWGFANNKDVPSWVEEVATRTVPRIRVKFQRRFCWMIST